MARALALQARGHRFESDILHERRQELSSDDQSIPTDKSGGSSVRIRYPPRKECEIECECEIEREGVFSKVEQPVLSGPISQSTNLTNQQISPLGAFDPVRFRSYLPKGRREKRPTIARQPKYPAKDLT